MIGVEIVAITAFEARDRESLREPSRWIAWIITFIYLFVAIPGALAVPWGNRFLPELEPKPAARPQKEVVSPIPPIKNGCQPYYPLIVVAAYRYGSKAAAYYFNACIVYFCISAANTALYVASRTLYGLMREDQPRDLYNLPWTQKIIQSPWILGRVSPRSHVPQWSLLASGLAFVWLVGLRAASSSSAAEVCYPVKF
jgi:yeast amino acid transporter